MDFRLGENSDALRDEARQFLDDHLTDDVLKQMHTTGVHHDPEFHRARVDHGMLAPGWPEEYGGQGRDNLEVLAMAEEFQTAGRTNLWRQHDTHGGQRDSAHGDGGTEAPHRSSGPERRDHHRARLHRARGGFRRRRRADARRNATATSG